MPWFRSVSLECPGHYRGALHRCYVDGTLKMRPTLRGLGVAWPFFDCIEGRYTYVGWTGHVKRGQPLVIMWWVGMWVKPTPKLGNQAQRSRCCMVTQQPRHTHTRPTQQDANRREQARRQSGLERQWCTRPLARASSAHRDPCSGSRTPTNTRTHPQRQTPRRTHTHNPWARPHTRTQPPPPPPGPAETHRPSHHPACAHTGPKPSIQTLNPSPQP